MTSISEPTITNQWDFIPFWTPMLKGDTCEKDECVFWKRMALIASVALSFFVAAVLYPSLSVLCIFLGLSVLPIPIIDGYLTDKEAERREDRRAVDEYLSDALPSKRATIRIRNSLELAKELIGHGGAINKVNIIGQRLLTPEVLVGLEPEMELFSLLAQNGYDFLMETRLDPVNGFIRVASSPNLEKLRLLLEGEILAPDKLSHEQTVELWLCLGSVEAGHLLKHYGFDVNQVDDNGFSPLYKLIFDLRFETQMERHELFQLYLDLGADTTKQVSLDGVEYHAFQLNHLVQQVLAERGGSQLHSEFERMLLEHHQSLSD